MTRLFLIIIIILLCSNDKLRAQLPTCDKIYMRWSAATLAATPHISTFDPNLPVSSTNPSINSIPPSGPGLAVSPILGDTDYTLTFYSVDGQSTYWYYNYRTNSWVNTGHYSGSPVAGNLGAGGGYIYSLDGSNKNVYRYDGTGNATFVVNVGNGTHVVPWDIIADCQGNFYIINSSSVSSYIPLTIRKYAPTGTLLQSWVLANNISSSMPISSSSLAIIGNRLFMDTTAPINFTSGLAFCTFGATTVSVDSFRDLGFPLNGDMASCAGFTLNLPTVNITTPRNNVCAGTSVTFNATASTAGPAPIYTWRVNGVRVGTNDTTYIYTPSNGDTVTCSMMSSSYCASQVNVKSNAIVMQVLPYTTPSVSITPSDTGIICPGTAVTFNAIPVNGGPQPGYQWKKNNIVVSPGTTSNFTTSTLANNDTIQVVMTSSALCNTVPTASSNRLPVRTGIPTPGVSLTVTPLNICSGDSVTFIASPSYGGYTPTFQWTRNGTVVGSSSGGTVYSSKTLQSGDTVSVVLTSGISCASPQQASSSKVVSVSPSVVPGINVNAFPGLVVCTGDSVQFITNITGGGSNPQYRWYKNGIPISGAIGANLTTPALSTGDTLQVLLSSSATCARPVAARSNLVGLVVDSIIAPTVTASVIPGTRIFPGQTVTFTAKATGGGASPAFQWQKNGVDIPFATDSIYSTNALTEGDVVTVSMISSAHCPAPETVKSPSRIMHTNALSVSENNDALLRVYPNPCHQSFHIDVPAKTPLTYSLISLEGKHIMRGESSGKASVEVILSPGIMPGIYFVELDTESDRRVYKLAVE